MHALLLTLALAGWPLPLDAGVADFADAGNWPNDPDFGNQWPFFSFSPGLAPAPSGARIDRAWSWSRGNPSVVLAQVTAAAPFGEARLRTRWALNLGELKLPRLADGGTSVFDLNGDGRVDVRDWEQDPRVTDRNGNGFLDPDDLLAAFADGVDDDGNGKIDDVCGWDFVVGRPARLAADAGAVDFLILGEPINDGLGGAGVCPECSLLPLVSDDTPERLAAAIDYAVRSKAAALATGPALGGSARLTQSLQQTTTLVVTAGRPRRTWALDWPALDPSVLWVSTIGPSSADVALAPDFALQSRCAARGVAVGVLAPSASCSEGAAALTAGVAGLARSIAPLTIPELRQLLTAPGARLDAAGVLERSTSSVPTISFTAPIAFSEHPRDQPLEVSATTPLLPPGAVLELSAAVGFDPTPSGFVPAVGGKVSLPQLMTAPGDLALDPHALVVTVRAVVRAGGQVQAETRREIFIAQNGEAAPLETRSLLVGSAAPHLLDLDGDGSDELMVADLDGQLHAFTSEDAELPGFPLTLGGPVALAPAIWLPAPRDFHLYTVTVDGVLESSSTRVDFSVPLGAPVRVAPVLAPSPSGVLVAVADQLGRLHVRRADGSAWPGSPFPLAGAPSGPLATHDFDGDGWPEFVAVGGGQAVRLRVTPSGLELATGWPVPSTSLGAALGDLDGDGTTEVLLDRVVDANGLDRLSFPFSGPPASPITLGDLDGDGLLEAIVTEVTADGLQVHLLPLGRALARGDQLVLDHAGWPQALPDQPAPGGALVLDVDGDNQPEVVIGSAFAVMAFSSIGAPAAGFPRSAAGTVTGLTTGWAGRDLQLIATTSSGTFRRWAARGFPAVTQWETAGHDAQHTNDFGTPLPLRRIPGLGVPSPQHRPPGCGCVAVPWPSALIALAGAFVVRRRRLRRSPIP